LDGSAPPNSIEDWVNLLVLDVVEGGADSPKAIDDCWVLLGLTLTGAEGVSLLLKIDDVVPFN
jgi:hypothetical protein